VRDYSFYWFRGGFHMVSSAISAFKSNTPSRAALCMTFSLMVLVSFAGASSESLPEYPSVESRLTIDRLYSLPSLIGTEPRGFAWSGDGRYLAFLWNDQGFNFRDVWMIDVEDPNLEPRRVTSMPGTEVDMANQDDPVATARALDQQERDPGVTSVTWHPDGQQMLLTFRGDLWLVNRHAEITRLTETQATESQASYSPSGSQLAFLRGGELWTAPATISPAFQVTVKTHLFQPDLEIADFRWSPDGSKLAIRQSDERQVALRGIPDYLAEETELVEVRRAYPGEEPSRHRVGLLDPAAGEVGEGDVRWLDWQGDEPDMILSYRWSPDGKRLAVDTSDLYAKDRRIFVADVAAGGTLAPRLVARDQDPFNEAFYFWRIEWATDSGLIYFLSDREEDYHVWAVPPSGGAEPTRLTRGAWAVAEIFPVDRGLIVVGNRGRAEERHLFRVDNEGGEVVQISRRAGTHTPTVSPDGRYAAVHFSSQQMPPELLLTSLPDPAGIAAGSDTRTAGMEASERRVTHSPIAAFSKHRWVEAEFVTFASHIDGTTLHGRLTLPPDFDPSRKYPAILGSVYTDSVRNQWGGRTAHPTWGLDQFLAQEGYVLLNVDMRGSWGRGREHRRAIRLDYGGIDIEDLESGVRFLENLGYVDMERIGIWGSSYGGLMTAMSLFRKPGLYAAGIAGAPATNVWHALTGQMAVMMRPQDQPDEYADSSPFMHAHGLEDPLMIIHGMRDWVVLFKDSVILVQRLILLGKDVDLVALPDAGHGWDNEGLAQTRFAFHKMVDFFDRHLKGVERE
jgi:dipeptidyl-peptidase-4